MAMTSWKYTLCKAVKRPGKNRNESSEMETADSCIR